MSAEVGMTTPSVAGLADGRDQLFRYLDASTTLESTRTEVEQLEQTAAVEAFHHQMELLKRRLLTQPESFREMFISDGMSAVAWEFQQQELSEQFTRTLWEMLVRDDDSSAVLMRFLWSVPLGMKRKFIRAIDAHLSDRYPMFDGLSRDWPAGNMIPPYVREAQERARDFGLVNQGYLGYMNLGYSAHEVELFVWLEALRDKQCEEKPCEVGVYIPNKAEPLGGCPVKIHIPEVLALVGTGRFREAMELIESCNPLPDVTGRVCPQEMQCQGVCVQNKMPISIGQLEWYLPEREKLLNPGGDVQRFAGVVDPWMTGRKPPVAIVGSGPSGLINAYLLAVEGFPVTVFEAFHALGGVLRYGIPEFRLPNELIDDVVGKIKLLGGKFVQNFVVGKTATLQDLRDAGFWKIFVGTGAGLPRFMNVPGEHLLNVMSANEFLTRVNLMQALREDYETPLPDIKGKEVLIIGGGNTAMDAARTAERLGGNVTIVYRRTQSEMPARVEELHHALEEGIALQVLRSPTEFLGNEDNFVTAAVLDIMELGEPDASGRRSPVATDQHETKKADLVIMALGNSANPIIKDSEPRLKVSKWGTIDLERTGSQETALIGVFTGGDAARGGSTAIRAAGDGQAAAREIVGSIDLGPETIRKMVKSAHDYTELGQQQQKILSKKHLADGIEEFNVYAPLIASSAKAGQFVRVLAWEDGELIPLTIADFDRETGTVCLCVQGMGTSSFEINKMEVGDHFAGIAGPLGMPSDLHHYDPATETVVFTAGGLGLPPAYPIVREHLQLGNHVTLISGFRSAGLQFWTAEGERVPQLQREFGDLLEVVYTSNDGSFGIPGFVTGPLEEMLKANQAGDPNVRKVAEVVTIGPPMMMRAVSDMCRSYGAKCVASLNSIMVDATGMCGACMVPVVIDGKTVRKHACIDGPEIDAGIIDWDKFLPRFNLFKKQELESKVRHGLA